MAMDQRVVQLEEWTAIIWKWLTSFYHDEYGEDLASSVISEKFQEANKKIGDLQEEVRILKMKVEFLEQTVDGLKDKKINLLHPSPVCSTRSIGTKSCIFLVKPPKHYMNGSIVVQKSSNNTEKKKHESRKIILTFQYTGCLKGIFIGFIFLPT